VDRDERRKPGFIGAVKRAGEDQTADAEDL